MRRPQQQPSIPSAGKDSVQDRADNKDVRTVMLDRERLLAHRRKRGWSQPMAMHGTGVSYKTLARAETGKAIRLGFANVIASHYGVEVSDLLPPSPDIPIPFVDDIEPGVTFTSPFEPDDMTIEFAFEEMFRRAGTVVEVKANSFSPPRGPVQIEMFRQAVTAAPVPIHWHPQTMQLATRVRELLSAVRRPHNEGSTFHGVEASRTRASLMALRTCDTHIQALLSNVPERLPWVWLALREYYGPFSSGPNIFGAIKNFIRFASLDLHHSCASALRFVAREISFPPPEGTDLIDLQTHWEHNLSVFSGDLFGDEKKDDIVNCYVTTISGVRLPREICIYGPRSLATRAYCESMQRRPIISPWFARYLVPQVELEFALNRCEEPTSYCEEAWIRKCVTLEGRDIEPDRWDLSDLN